MVAPDSSVLNIVWYIHPNATLLCFLLLVTDVAIGAFSALGLLRESVPAVADKWPMICPHR